MTSKIVKKVGRPADKVLNRGCIGCGKIDSFAYRGSMLVGTQWVGQKVTQRQPWDIGLFSEPGQPVDMVVVGGELVESTKRYPINKRVSGVICRDCASNYKTIETRHRDGSSSWEPVVKIQSEIIGQTIVPTVERLRSESTHEGEVLSPMTPSPSSPQPLRQAKGQPNHWLDVGRRRS